jgi:methionyl-tRNA synthetase
MVDYKCNICKKNPIIKETTHLFIKLPEIVDELKKWIEGACKIWSANSTSITYSWINMGLKNKCITRDLKWGVPVPN